MSAIPHSPENLFQCLMAYQETCEPTVFSQVQSSLIRYALPELGISLLPYKRLTPAYIEIAYNFMKDLPLSTFKQLESHHENGLIKLQVSQDNQRKYRFNFNKFLAWSSVQPWAITQSTQNQPPKLYRFSGERHSKIERKRLTNGEKQAPHILSLDPKQYQTSEKAPIELERIKQELQDLSEFLQENHFKSYTIEMRILVIKEILGWLYQYEKVPLTNLSLSSIVKVIVIKISITDYSSYKEFLFKKELVAKQAKQAAEDSINILDRYFKSKPTSLMPRTKEMYTESVLTLAKFLYREQTNRLYNRNYEDISVVKRLRILRNQYRSEAENQPRAVPYEKKAVSWETALIVLERTRQEAIMTHTEYLKDGKPQGKKRKLDVIAHSFMKFLLLAMFTLISPDRQRTYQELRIGKTLKHGFWQENIFIPKDQMRDPNQAAFYIHLLPEDYKTGETYGEWVGKLPNTQFSDGTTFYQYLELWLYGAKDNNPVATILKLKNSPPLRDFLAPKDHDYVFFGFLNKMPLGKSSISSVIQHIFERMTNTPVRPHILRNMFRTYIDEIGISDEESKSIAFWMKHDLRTANKYSRQQCRSKLAPGESLIQRISNNLLGTIPTSQL